eukprot:CAMPEP_0184499102 /NCGR_PEP_ID=MMETSP0113_2-20130426/40636_1 /TAXON_ID=91329 /ORGANISM="Norrisiella sphaerica, Strain BC52" /LENGTH=304 /DNA_ID=CAMNT_0026886885 /DNA_START=452 /DNA_END=1367 /DNA_ORIENTATION=+
MNWVGRPVYSNAFSLRSGNSENQLNDPTTYRPNEWIDIYLTTHEYTQKFRGLIIHAMSSNMSHVGIWNSTDTSFRSKSKWMNPEPSCIMHRDASLKPLRIHFRFKGPPRGTGNITLKALIKVGPAHRGWFYYPNGRDPNLKGVVPVEGFPGTGNDLILYEAAERNLTWIEGKLGESCNEACNSRGLLCDQQALRDNQLSTPEEIEGKLTGIEFLLPLAASCARVAPAKSVNGLSWYNVANNIDGDEFVSPFPNPGSKQLAEVATQLRKDFVHVLRYENNLKKCARVDLHRKGRSLMPAQRMKRL